MKAAVIRENEGEKILQTEEVDCPQIADNEALVKIANVGICGSDLHGFIDPNSRGRIPGLIMGHEAAGEVVKVGSNVTRVKVGDRVAIDPQVTCGTCYACQHGWYSVCDNKKVIGSSLRGFMQGAMADYASIDQKQLFVLPDHVSMEEGAMVEPVSNAIHVLNRVKFNLGDNVVVLGAGTLGLCILQAAKLAGAGKVIVTDMSEFRLKIARELGADLTIDASKVNPVEEIKALTNNLGADVVIEAVGIDTTYRQAIAMVRKKGSVMFFGAVQDTVNVDLYPILHKELNLIGCTGADTESQTAVDFIADGRINVKPIITHHFPLTQAQGAFDLLKSPNNHAIKVLLAP